ncbi:Arm DNA-binding domain-containing protein [Cronobacter dublinensis]|uniref:Arm DNA-binding domain-containing protein n=1 Tax=Cronobacter dublinensis TaxID=413497 RepID=UPI00292CE777|nr:Arm DNA-binding domain-containing protein [Cronobacter dublinensis]WNY81980.1 Arm DNA-binding domain-containing protein [Cronobacter dublinensis]
MAGKQKAKLLSFKAIEMMTPGDKDKADISENRGLRVSCGATGVKSFFYPYTSPMTGKLAQVKIGNFPQTSLAVARLKLNELKLLRQEGRCPASELKQEKHLRAIEAEQAKVPELTVQGLVERTESRD